MRDFKNMKRQRGRNRGGGGGGGAKPQHNANRAFDSNGPDNVKIRGHAQHVFEKYQQLARDAFSSGDRVLAENYLQHADHYFRVLRTIQPQRPPSEILGRDVLASGLDIDFEEEFEAQPEEGSAEAPAEAGGELNGEGGRAQRDERPQQREDRAPREDRFDRDARREGYEREARQTGEGYRDRGERNDRNDRGGERNDRFERGEGRDRFEGRRERRYEGRRDERPYAQPRDGRDRFEERRPVEASTSDPMPVVAPEAVGGFPVAPVEAAEGSPVLRSEDGAQSEAPAFLQGPAGEDGEARRPRPRRRRAPRSFEPGEGEDLAPAAQTEEV
jgi:hypothetical protein